VDTGPDMAASWRSLHPLAYRALLVAGTLIGIVLVLTLGLSLVSDNLWKRWIVSAVEHQTGRRAGIEGAVHVRLWRRAPELAVDGFHLQNANWAADRPMLVVRHVEMAVTWSSLLRLSPVFTVIRIDGPDLDLERDAKSRANWEFSKPAVTKRASRAPMRLPVIRQLIVSDGRLQASDAIRKLKFDGDISVAERQRKNDEGALRVRGKGALNGKPFTLRVAGGPLLQVEAGKPYDFDANVTAADIKLEAHTEIPRAFDLDALTSKIHLSGKDLADFYYLTGLALPNSSPYDVTGLVRRKGMRFEIEDLKGRFGKSDVHGQLSLYTGGPRPLLKAQLTSSQLHLVDLAAPLGTQVTAANKSDTLAQSNSKASPVNPRSKPGKRARAAVAAVDAQAQQTGYLLPDADLQVERARAMDADVQFEAGAIQAGKMPLKRVRFHLLLNQGQLTLDPLEFTLPEGEFAGRVMVDARQTVPVSDIDMHLKNLNLAQFTSKAGGPPALEGRMLGRLRMHGSGSSVHKTAANANGDLTVVLPHGRMRAAFAELTGINLDRGLGLLLTNKEQSTDIRCGVASFRARNGDLQANTLLIDTTHVLVTGEGKVDLKNEGIDISLSGKPKQIRLVRLRSPIEIRGTLAHPSVGLEAGRLAGQAGAAAALGTLLTPLAAILAFVDGGLAKDADCAAVMSQAGAPAGPGTSDEAPRKE